MKKNNFLKTADKESFGYWVLLNRGKAFLSTLLLIAFLNLISGCNYMTVKTYENLDSQQDLELLKKMHQRDKYIVFHIGEEAWHLDNISVDTDKQEMIAFAQKISQADYSGHNVEGSGTYRYYPKAGNDPFEAHIYSSKEVTFNSGQIKVPLKSISRIDINDREIAATTATYIFGGIGITIGVIVVIGVILIATKSSCPFVYTTDGTGKHFVGEMYSGAIYSSLERDDYMPLTKFSAIDGNYKINISNELLERQYTNVAEIMTINHPSNMEVLLDKKGDLQTITNPEMPKMAISEGGQNLLETISKKDNSTYLFDFENIRNQEMSNLNLTFQNKNHSSQGKLVLKAKNSYWLDYVFGKFNEQFGTYYNKFQAEQRKVPANDHIQWGLDQGIPLSVFIKTSSGWKFVDYFNVIGPLASREIVMPIHIPNPKDEEIEIRLECGYMFWEVDYAAMDFTKNIPLEVNIIKPSIALDEKGNDIRKSIYNDDKDYLQQPNIGNSAILLFPEKKKKEGEKQSIFLHSKGYYEYIRNYKNAPDYYNLISFKRKRAFTKFSKSEYNLFVKKEVVLASKEEKLMQNNDN